MRLYSDVLAQQVVQTSLGGHPSRWMNCSYQVVASTSKLYNAIQRYSWLSAVEAKAGLYIFLRLIVICTASTMMNNLSLISWKQEKVLLVHGRGFNWKDQTTSVFIFHVLIGNPEKMTRFERYLVDRAFIVKAGNICQGLLTNK